MRRSMKFVRWVTILKDKLRRQRCHLDNYSTCTVHCNQQVLEFQQKLPFFLLSVTSLNDIFCTFKREKKKLLFFQGQIETFTCQSFLLHVHFQPSCLTSWPEPSHPKSWKCTFLLLVTWFWFLFHVHCQSVRK